MRLGTIGDRRGYNLSEERRKRGWKRFSRESQLTEEVTLLWEMETQCYSVAKDGDAFLKCSNELNDFDRKVISRGSRIFFLRK